MHSYFQVDVDIIDLEDVEDGEEVAATLITVGDWAAQWDQLEREW